MKRFIGGVAVLVLVILAVFGLSRIRLKNQNEGKALFDLQAEVYGNLLDLDDEIESIIEYAINNNFPNDFIERLESLQDNAGHAVGRYEDFFIALDLPEY